MRALSPHNIYSRVHKTFKFSHEFEALMGAPETTGVWIIYGKEKNGKTWFTLRLANYLSTLAKVLYVSAEEGTSAAFKETMSRANIGSDNRNLSFLEYTELDEITERLKKRRAPEVLILDNATIYEDDFRAGGFRKFIRKNPKTLVILVAHEERGEPYTAAAKLAKKLASIIIRVEGLKAIFSGRCPGGEIAIDYDKSELYHLAK